MDSHKWLGQALHRCIRSPNGSLAVEMTVNQSARQTKEDDVYNYNGIGALLLWPLLSARRLLVLFVRHRNG